MMNSPEVVPRSRQVAALALPLVLLGVGSALALTASGRPLDWYQLPWPVLVPLYVMARLFGAEIVRMGESITITMVHLPLILGAVLVDPAMHLLAVLVSVAATCAYRRQGLLKSCVNLSFGALEVGVIVAAVSLAPTANAPGPGLWLALLAGLIAGDAVTAQALNVVLAALGKPVDWREATASTLRRLPASVMFASLGILTLWAAWVDPWVVLTVVAFVVPLIAAYRGYTRLVAEQSVTENLYEFVKRLGPVTPGDERLSDALNSVRQLMHCTEADLDLYAAQGVVPVRLRAGAVQTEAEAASGRRSAAVFDNTQECVSAPLITDAGIAGLLTVRGRLGEVRGFDIRDVRLLETVASELATALERGRLLAELRVAATRDPLTGLANLRQVGHEIDALLQVGPAIVAAITVDGFREVNDTLGHLIGDELLSEVAERLQRAFPDAVLGRIGGGRFAIAVPAKKVAGDAALFGLRLRTAVEGGLQIGAVGTHVRLSVGCVQGPDNGPDSATLLRRAETAMYSARGAQGGPVLWEPAYEVQGQRRMAVVMALRDAVATGAIGVAFQPKIRAVDGSVAGVEALARWTHPALGGISPDEFIPLAEASGLIGILTTSILRQSLTACRGWQRRGGRVGVAVNVSASTILDPDFVGEVRRALKETGLEAELLTLELTESVVLAEPEQAAERMSELRRLGVRLSIDDFGTGYSSLTYLKGLPIHEVKIDRGFVTHLVRDAADQAVVRAVVDIAHTLGMSVVAEGLESAEQQQLLERLGVDEFQGYLYARPMPALKMASWLRGEARSLSSSSD